MAMPQVAEEVAHHIRSDFLSACVKNDLLQTYVVILPLHLHEMLSFPKVSYEGLSMMKVNLTSNNKMAATGT